MKTSGSPSKKSISKINTSILPKSSVDEIISTKKALPIIIDLTSETDKYFDLLLIEVTSNNILK